MATRSRKLTGSADALIAYFNQRELKGLEEYYTQRDRGSDQDREKQSRDHDDVVFSKVRGGSPSGSAVAADPPAVRRPRQL